MIKRYLRNENSQPFGMVVVDGSSAGWSLCCQKDRFNKKLGEKIAVNRIGTDWNEDLTKRMPYQQDKIKTWVKKGKEYMMYQSRIEAVYGKITYLLNKPLAFKETV